MKLLLLDNVEKVGKVGDVVEVRGGYSRNYLIPMGLAVTANDGQIRFHQERLEKARKKLDEELAVLKVVADEIGGIELEIAKKATDDGKLFGSVTVNDIKELLHEKAKDLDIDKLKISLDKVEKKIGVYPVAIKFGHDLEIECKINIKKKEK
jgi:large subunit ribosomal protein L9